MDICVDIYFPFSQVYLPRSGIPGSCGNCLNFSGTKLFAKATTPFFIPINSVWGFQFPNFLANAYFYLSCWLWASLCVYFVIVVLASIALMLRTFSYVYWPFVYLLWRNVYLHPLPILKWGYLWRHEFKITWSSNTNILCRVCFHLWIKVLRSMNIVKDSPSTQGNKTTWARISRNNG